MNPRDVAEIFDARAARYATDDWHRRYAERFVAALPLAEGARVLDAGGGTGFAACAIARRIGPRGYVLAVDISTKMLDEARATLTRERLDNVELLEADVTALPTLDDGTFDAVVCSAGLLYMSAVQAVAEWRRLLKADGLLAFSTMQAGSPSAGRIFRECAARFGLHVVDPSDALGTEERCRLLLEAGGFDRIHVVADRVDFADVDATRAWEANFRAARRTASGILSADDEPRLRDMFVTALTNTMQRDPETATRADVLYAFGQRAA